jgi:uncharacterized phage infection (PIP) family protein YhgE
MASTENNQKSRIGIIGGGKVGYNLFLLFFNSSLTQVVYVVDRNTSAPAMAAATRNRVRTYTDFKKAQDEYPADIIFEVTGVAQIAAALSFYEANGVKVISHDTAFIILSVIDENNRTLKDQVINEMTGIKQEIDHSLEGVERLVDGIDNVTSNMKMLSINARIEAARVGDAGRGFAVVAQHMNESADAVHNLAREIEGVNKNVREVSNQMDKTLEKLK